MAPSAKWQIEIPADEMREVHPYREPSRSKLFEFSSAPVYPEVERRMPASPELVQRIVIRHAPQHVLRWIHSIQHGPETEETPNYHEFQPHDLQ